MKWKVKAALQDVISLLPGADYLNTLLQRHVTRRLMLTPPRFEVKLSQCRRHLEYTQAALGRPEQGFNVLELGTGWHPVIPMAMVLCGASKVWTVDIASLLNRDRVLESAKLLLDYARDGRLKEHLPGFRPERLEALTALVGGDRRHDVTEMLAGMNIVPMVADVRSVDLGGEGVDLFISNCVLEHIPAEVIRGIFLKFRSLGRPGSVMSHLVDMADHYADYDPSIGVFNFLKYSARSWRWFNCKLHYQNRLRLAAHRRLHAEAGYKILREVNVEGSAGELDKIPLAEEFKNIPPQELLVIKAWIVSVPDGAVAGLA